jgi:hypothetical protein
MYSGSLIFTSSHTLVVAVFMRVTAESWLPEYSIEQGKLNVWDESERRVLAHTTDIPPSV